MYNHISSRFYSFYIDVYLFAANVLFLYIDKNIAKIFSYRSVNTISWIIFTIGNVDSFEIVSITLHKVLTQNYHISIEIF